MPLFEYQCRDCSKPFEAFVTVDRVPSCPACHGSNLAKLLSSPGMVRVASGKPADSCAAPSMGMCGARGGHCGCAH